MKRQWRALGALTVMAAALAITPGAASAQTTIATARNNGKTVDVNRGGRLQVRLGSCEASCGYRWKSLRAPDPRILRYTGTGYDGRIRRFSYGADKSGVTRLKLGYYPPGGKRPARIYNLRVRVSPAPVCTAPSSGSTLLNGPASVVYATPGTGNASVLVGCLRGLGRSFAIFHSTSSTARLATLKGRYAAYVERAQPAGARPTNTVQVYDVGTGRQLWQVGAATDAPQAPYDEVTALGVTYQGDAAWIIRKAATTQLWVRSGGSVHLADQGNIDPSNVSTDGDIAYYRKDGAGQSVTLNAPPSPVVLGEQDGRGETIVRRVGQTIVVRVPSCESSCGYSWQFARRLNQNVLLHVSNRHIVDENGEFREFVFSAVGKTGTSYLELNYVPPGGGGVQREFKVRVVVR